ncbi:hypothetical protein ZIOFF_006415 [Zingiber officinale]|uniref:AT3G52170-like helix-turn-helix domain-containing protein n=1 Tax=Zingiber officinale TaxID=94328 RepID=A0A8J5HPR2_ZINOF|nr:hypothetical protein ZIOFF_006415 [Zingiber officinale]
MCHSSRSTDAGSFSIGSSSALNQTSPTSQEKSSAASVPSISCKSQRGRRISKEERRALVESFVGKRIESHLATSPNLADECSHNASNVLKDSPQSDEIDDLPHALVEASLDALATLSLDASSTTCITSNTISLELARSSPSFNSRIVARYRAQNAGIFPSVSKVQMEVGGSYYVIREMVQELEYNAKLASFNKVIRQPGKLEGSAQISDAAMSSAIVADEILKSSTMIKDEPSVVIEADALQIPPGEPVGCQTEISTIEENVLDEPSVVIEADASQIPPEEPVVCQTEISTIEEDVLDEPSVVIEADASQIPPGEPVGCQTEINTIDSSADVPDQKVVKHARSNTTLGTDMEDSQPISDWVH